jgi:hypothetical protein
MDDYSSAKAEVERLFGLDLQVGDKLRRINLPKDWPEETLTVVGYELHEKGGPCLRVTGEVKRFCNEFAIETKNIGVLYERA